ncbi:nuclear transport factor 2 family protein [Phenylobacterium sp.]|uniref:nuclear transport factor 2 family protein n=1 Tax=Phenylobacterium sp. TaxID=1871053 RepID=UPI0025D7F7F9|nr:nuclear transport factor 2 family protein [Phenylobacterium sp.]
MTIDDMLDIERIRKLRILYSYYLDAGEIDRLVALFTDDAVCEFGPFGVWEGVEMIAENYRRVMGPVIEKGPFQSLHANTNHWVEITGPDTALGRLYLIDLAFGGPPETNPMVWLGVYDEAYTRVAGQWRIQRSGLQFMWPQRHVSDNFPGAHLPIGSQGGTASMSTDHPPR